MKEIDVIEQIIKTSYLLPKHVISLHDFNRETVENLFTLANLFKESSSMVHLNILKGRVAGTLFYQPSTRTRLNFHSAIQRLGATYIGFSDPATTRAGDYYQESLEDVIKFTSELADILILRHNETGASIRSTLVSKVPIISAGDGYNEHPTQGLGDIWTIHNELNGINNKIIGFIGDLNIRSLKSIIIGLKNFDIKCFMFLLPPDKEIPVVIKELLLKYQISYYIVQDVIELLEQADLIETIGIRHPNHTLKHDSRKIDECTPDRFKIDSNKIHRIGRFIPILHPGPRIDEVSSDVDLLANAAYFRQANNGMWMRMALISSLLYKEN